MEPLISEPSQDKATDQDHGDRFGAYRPMVYAQPIAVDRIDADAVKVLRRLTRHDHTAYLVGGGVRDLLLGRKPKDFDVATSARPSEVRQLFRNCRIIGRRFRLAHILFADRKVIEVATFRRDPDTEAAARDVEGATDAVKLVPSVKHRDDEADLLIRNDNVFGDPHEDAIRRDFTINGLFYDLRRQEVIDYVGGLPDLRKGVVRTIGQPDVRFREDPVRILRAIKFSARLDLGIAPDVYDAMVDQREELRRAARPRVLEEVLRLLRGGAARRSIYLAWDVGVLGSLLPELTAFVEDSTSGARQVWCRLAAIDALQREGRLPSDAVLIAALFMGVLDEALEGADDPASAYDATFDELTESLAVPRRIKDRTRLILGVQARLRRGKLGGMVRREFFADAAALYEVQARGSGQPLPEWLAEPPKPTPSRGRRRRRRRPPRP